MTGEERHRSGRALASGRAREAGAHRRLTSTSTLPPSWRRSVARAGTAVSKFRPVQVWHAECAFADLQESGTGRQAWQGLVLPAAESSTWTPDHHVARPHRNSSAQPLARQMRAHRPSMPSINVLRIRSTVQPVCTGAAAGAAPEHVPCMPRAACDPPRAPCCCAAQSHGAQPACMCPSMPQLGCRLQQHTGAAEAAVAAHAPTAGRSVLSNHIFDVRADYSALRPPQAALLRGSCRRPTEQPRK